MNNKASSWQVQERQLNSTGTLHKLSRYVLLLKGHLSAFSIDSGFFHQYHKTAGLDRFAEFTLSDTSVPALTFACILL